MVSELNFLSCVGVKARVCEARFKKSRSSEARWFFEQKSEAKTGFYCH